MRNNVKNIIAGLLLVLLGAGWPFTVYLLHQNEDLITEVVERDKLIHDMRLHDSTFLSDTKKYSDTINKYISGCNISINGKKISVEELVGMLNASYKEKAKLQDSIIKLHLDQVQRVTLMNKYIDSFSTYKTLSLYIQKKHNLFYKINKDEKGNYILNSLGGFDSNYVNKTILGFIKRDYGIEYEVDFNSDRSVYSFRRKPSISDSADLFKKVLELEKKVYKVDYKIESSGNMISYSVFSPTLDSALMLFPFFKHMLKENKDKDVWNIDISPKKVREARKVKVE